MDGIAQGKKALGRKAGGFLIPGKNTGHVGFKALGYSVRAVLVAFMILVAPFRLHAQSSDMNTLIRSYGLAGSSCATWLSSPTSVYGGSQWIFGFWSGLNQQTVFDGGQGSVGKSTDQAGIVAEVKKVCSEEPSSQLQDAAGKVFYRFQRLGR